MQRRGGGGQNSPSSSRSSNGGVVMGGDGQDTPSVSHSSNEGVVGNDFSVISNSRIEPKKNWHTFAPTPSSLDAGWPVLSE